MSANGNCTNSWCQKMLQQRRTRSRWKWGKMGRSMRPISKRRYQSTQCEQYMIDDAQRRRCLSRYRAEKPVMRRQATASSHCTTVPPYDEDLVSPHPCCVLPSIIAANDFGGELKALYDSMNPTGIFPTLLTAWTLLS